MKCVTFVPTFRSKKRDDPSPTGKHTTRQGISPLCNELSVVIERLAPARKDRPVWFDLPAMKEVTDAVNASAAIVAAVANGDLTPMEAAELGKVVDSYARTLQTVEFEERISKLEKAITK